MTQYQKEESTRNVLVVMNLDRDKIIEECAEECDEVARICNEEANKLPPLQIERAVHLDQRAVSAENCARRIRKLKIRTGFD